MDSKIKLIGCGVWVPVLYLLTVYPSYVLLMFYLYQSAGIVTMDAIFETIGNLELLVSGVLALVVGALVIYVLLNNEYRKTQKKVYAANLEAMKAGAEVDSYKMEQLAKFDRAYTKAMVAFALLDGIVSAGVILAASFFFAQFALLPVCIVSAIVLGAVLGLIFEKAAQLVGDGSLDVKATDYLLAAIAKFREQSAPASPETVTPVSEISPEEFMSAMFNMVNKFGKA